MEGTASSGAQVWICNGPDHDVGAAWRRGEAKLRAGEERHDLLNSALVLHDHFHFTFATS